MRKVHSINWLSVPSIKEIFAQLFELAFRVQNFHNSSVGSGARLSPAPCSAALGTVLKIDCSTVCAVAGDCFACEPRTSEEGTTATLSLSLGMHASPPGGWLASLGAVLDWLSAVDGRIAGALLQLSLDTLI
eukprot:SAG31_NODE_4081_length_3608_cov_3.369336_4_plen_132_part_00